MTTDPHVERVYAPESLDGSEGLLAVIVRSGFNRPGVTFFSEANQPLQLASMRHPVGTIVKPHKHIVNPRHIEQTQEVIVVLSGTMSLSLYTSSGVFVSKGVLETGDTVHLVSGGHSLEVLYADAHFVEIKTGPYYGRERDKVDL